MMLLLIDLSDVRTLRCWALMMMLRLLLVIFIIVTHVFFMLILFNGLSAHHVMIHGYLSAMVFIVFIPFVIIILVVFIVLLLILLLLLLLLVFLEHEEILLLLIGEGTLRRHVAGEVCCRCIQAIIVLSWEKKLFLLVCQMGVRVQVCITKDVYVLLKFPNLSQVSHKSLWDLFNKQRLIGNIEQYLLFLLSICPFKEFILLSCPPHRLFLPLSELSSVAYECWRALDSLSKAVLLEESLNFLLELGLLLFLLRFLLLSSLSHIGTEFWGDCRVLFAVSLFGRGLREGGFRECGLGIGTEVFQCRIDKLVLSIQVASHTSCWLGVVEVEGLQDSWIHLLLLFQFF